MAERFGGKFSLQNAQTPSTSFAGAKRTKIGGRANLLFFLPLPLAIRAFFAPPQEMVLHLAAFGQLILSAWLTREGLKAEEAWSARTIARRPAIPRKIFGAICTGLGLGLAGFAASGSASAAMFAGFGFALHLGAFGFDPLRDKGIEGVDAFQTDRVARAVDEAEKHLKSMSEAIASTGDKALMRRLEAFQSRARALFRQVEEDPRDLAAARRYLSVYLMGARDASLKYAAIAQRQPNPEARAEYEALLDDLEKNFATRTQAFLTDTHADLTVEIDVLRERLAREGLRLEE
ncbi:MAG: hypothetical protein EBS68_07670 [Rhodobacteraceae bacterium]|nr:hypothetical protein [Paracoccaceae bacterium]